MRHKCGDGYGDSGGYCGGYVKTTTVVVTVVIRIEPLQKIFCAASLVRTRPAKEFGAAGKEKNPPGWGLEHEALVEGPVAALRGGGGGGGVFSLVLHCLGSQPF